MGISGKLLVQRWSVLRLATNTALKQDEDHATLGCIRNIIG